MADSKELTLNDSMIDYLELSAKTGDLMLPIQSGQETFFVFIVRGNNGKMMQEYLQMLHHPNVQ